MKFNEYRDLAFPVSMRESEKNKSIIWKINRYVGVIQSFLFYMIGVKANVLSMIRVVISCVGILLLFISDNLFYLLLGFVLIIWQVNLDFADGALARVHKSNDPNGLIIDGLGNEFTRIFFILMASYYSFSITYFMLGVVGVYVGNTVFHRIVTNNTDCNVVYREYCKIMRLLNSVVFSNIILVFLFVLCKVSETYLVTYMNGVVLLYFVSALPSFYYLSQDHSVRS